MLATAQVDGDQLDVVGDVVGDSVSARVTLTVTGRFLRVPRKSKSMSGAASTRTHPLDTMLAVSDVITNRRYAQLFATVLERGTPTVEEIATDVDSSTTTVYEDVNHLEEAGVLERVTDTQPHRYRSRSVRITLQTDDRSYRLTPTVLVALAWTESNENLELYLDRHGTAGLATAVEYARDYVRGRTNARSMARDEDIPVLEAETVLQELRTVLQEVEPTVVEDVAVGDLDEAVGDIDEAVDDLDDVGERGDEAGDATESGASTRE